MLPHLTGRGRWWQLMLAVPFNVDVESRNIIVRQGIHNMSHQSVRVRSVGNRTCVRQVFIFIL